MGVESHPVARRQAGVLTRAQLAHLGVDRAIAPRRAAAGRWQRLFPGVYLTHNGPIPWRSRAWAAVLYAGPGSALSHEAAAHLHGFAAPPRIIDVTIPASRAVAAQPGLRIHRTRSMPGVHGRPPATARGSTVVDLAERADRVDDIVGLITAAIRANVSAMDISETVAGRSRLRTRTLLTELIARVTEGSESPLEHRYHRDVERRHHLPQSKLQVRQIVGGRWIRADGIYEDLGVRVELDGELAHPGGRTDSDVWRDNAVLVERAELTLRYRWRHVAADPCATARQVEIALQSRGWTGRGRPCSPTCPLTRPPPGS